MRFTGKPRGSPAFNHSGTEHTSDHPRMIHRLPANYINYLNEEAGNPTIINIIDIFRLVATFLL